LQPYQQGDKYRSDSLWILHELDASTSTA
jgi:hypothetical protein